MLKTEPGQIGAVHANQGEEYSERDALLGKQPA